MKDSFYTLATFVCGGLLTAILIGITALVVAPKPEPSINVVRRLDTIQSVLDGETTSVVTMAIFNRLQNHAGAINKNRADCLWLMKQTNNLTSRILQLENEVTTH